MFGVAFNYDSGGGQIDPMRVTNNVRWGGAGDPLDPNLIFSALHPPGIAEQYDFYNGGNPNGWQPAFYTARTYSSPPLVLPCWLNDNGQRFYPGHVTAPATSRWLLNSEARNAGNNTYLCTIFVETTFNNANIMAGRLRVFVIGPGG